MYVYTYICIYMNGPKNYILFCVLFVLAFLAVLQVNPKVSHMLGKHYHMATSLDLPPWLDAVYGLALHLKINLEDAQAN